MHILYELTEDYPDRRLKFCGRTADLIRYSSNFINQIAFFNKATFCLNGLVNRHNCGYWSVESLLGAGVPHTAPPQCGLVWLESA